MDYLSKKSLGRVFRELRKEKKLTQAEFADLFEISRSFVSEIESGNKNPSTLLLNRISEKLDIPLAVIFLRTLNVDDIPDKSKEEILNEMVPIVEKLESYLKNPQKRVKT